MKIVIPRKPLSTEAKPQWFSRGDNFPLVQSILLTFLYESYRQCDLLWIVLMKTILILNDNESQFIWFVHVCV